MIKRKIACTRSVGRSQDAAELLVAYLDTFHSDADAWLELAELYRTLHFSEQAAFSFAEAILLKPFDYRVHTAHAEMQYAAAMQGGTLRSDVMLVALESFLRAIELNDGSVRALCGVRACCEALLQVKGSVVPSAVELTSINDKASRALASISKKDVAEETLNVIQLLASK